MKRLINIPLLIGAGAQTLFALYALMSRPWAGWEDGPSRGAMAFIMFEPAAVSWLMLLVAGMSAVFTDAFDWSPAASRTWRRLATAVVALAVIVTLGVCLAVALGTSPAVEAHDNDAFNAVLVAIARVGGIFGPFVAMGWLAWLINAPEARRHHRRVDQAVLGAFALTTLVGGVIGLQMLVEEIAVDRKVAAFNRQMIDERETENQAALRDATDTSSFREWLRLTDRLQTETVRRPAVRRLASRPMLETDLGAALQSSDTDEADEAMDLFTQLRFKPSSVLEAPLRAYIAALAGRIEVSRKTEGDGLHDDSYLDRWFGDQLGQLLFATRKMAEDAQVDLRDADRQLAQAVIDNYPTSKSAKSYPRGIAALDHPVEEAMAARRPH